MVNIDYLISPSCFRSQVVKKIAANEKKIEAWFSEKKKNSPTPPYTSVDLRDSGFKSIPVDSNAFPAGFNNICFEDWELAAQAFQKTFHFQKKKRILLIPENYTSNPFYFDNLRALQGILQLAEFETTIGHFNPELPSNLAPGITQLETSSKKKIILERLERKGDTLYTQQTEFSKEDLILLNNDLSNGLLDELKGLPHTITPHPSMGWFQRKKSTHLIHYQKLAQELAALLGIDPFLITARFAQVSGVNFQKGTGLDRLARAADKLIEQIASDYQKQDLKLSPFIFIKHNSGTHGRSITTAKSGAEIQKMNRRVKTKMNTSKGGAIVEDVLLMEGIPTDLSEKGESTEPVIYLAGHQAIGGFLRIHPKKNRQENLNTPGAHFKPLCFANIFKTPSPQTAVLEKFYGTLGRLSTLANGQEMQ